MLSDRLANNFLADLKKEQYVTQQPFMRLLRARILFRRGEIAEAIDETDAVLAFSRANQDRLRLVEAALQKIFMIAHGAAASRRESENLLREAIYYAYRDRILMPFYLDRETLLSLLKGLAAELPKKGEMNASEAAFVYDAVAICRSPAVKPEKQEKLSAREMEVLQELAQGITNREIAEKLCVSQATVKTHVLSIFSKLGVSSRMAAVEKARKQGLISGLSADG
jgi:LuxR family maltose regulon positive regulatory protein